MDYDISCVNILIFWVSYTYYNQSNLYIIDTLMIVGKFVLVLFSARANVMRRNSPTLLIWNFWKMTHKL